MLVAVPRRTGSMCGVEAGRDTSGGFVVVGSTMREVDEVGGGDLGQCGRVFREATTERPEGIRRVRSGSSLAY